MSALAIAGVTAVLKNLTLNYFSNPAIVTNLGTTPGVTAVTPDQAEDLHSDGDAMNWFMYRTALNSGLSTAFYPSRDSQGGRTERAPLAIDLYYLLSAYSSSDMHAELMLGYTLQLFHENPVLDRDAITAALATPSSGDATIITALNSANIPDRLDHITLCLHHPDDEWQSKLWGAMNAHFRTSVIVQASVILIESDIAVQPGLPVQRYEVDALPMTLPRIERIAPVLNPAGKVSFGDDIVITGSNLAAEVTRVQVGTLELGEADLPALSRSRIEIPGTALAGLRAGVNAVQIKHDLLLGVPQVPHRGFQSNVVPLILHPAISDVTPALADDGDGHLEGQIQVTIQPPVVRGQRVNLLLNGADSATTTGYNFRSAPLTSDTPVTDFTFTVAGIVPGAYFVRAQVDGASSQLAIDPDTHLIVEPPLNLS